MGSIAFNYAHENVHVKGYCTQMCSIGNRLREERERLGLKQEAFGQIGGVNRNSQAKYEKDERSPDGKYLEAIASAGADVLYIITGQRTPQAALSLSESESEVVGHYRRLSGTDQAAVQRLTHALAESSARYDVNKKDPD